MLDPHMTLRFSPTIRSFLHDLIVPYVTPIHLFHSTISKPRSLLDVPFIPYHQHPKVVGNDNDWIEKYQDLRKCLREPNEYDVADFMMHYMVQPLLVTKQISFDYKVVHYQNDHWRIYKYNKMERLYHYVEAFLHFIDKDQQYKLANTSKTFKRGVTEWIISGCTYNQKTLEFDRCWKINVDNPSVLYSGRLHVQTQHDLDQYLETEMSTETRQFNLDTSVKKILGIEPNLFFKLRNLYGVSEQSIRCRFKDNTIGIVITEYTQNFMEARRLLKLLEDWQTKQSQITFQMFANCEFAFSQKPGNTFIFHEQYKLHRPWVTIIRMSSG